MTIVSIPHFFFEDRCLNNSYYYLIFIVTYDIIYGNFNTKNTKINMYIHYCVYKQLTLVLCMCVRVCVSVCVCEDECVGVHVCV